MSWNDDLLPEQEKAASHIGAHARMLAGPGTGKTLVLTRRIAYLVQEQKVDPNQILALTFTRAASHELRQRVRSELGEESLPRISTLHSFALRQLLRNSGRLTTLPQPLRIADDWEERNIVLEDIKTILGLQRVSDVRELFNQLSADWQCLAADNGDFTPAPRFIGAWEEHRGLFGYTLRSELVYQLKRALEQLEAFTLEPHVRYLLVDEYQDLNRCDLAVIHAMESRGVELFVAGDDDQSIYGFRKAHPDGIRHFPQEYEGATDLPLRICKRCAPQILALAEFVAELDPRRETKETRPEDGRESGEVVLLRFEDQDAEARGVARLCKCLIEQDGYSPDDILILSRVDTRRAFSSVLEWAFEEQFAESGISLASGATELSPLDEPDGRQILSILRLLRNERDHLAWRTLLRLRRNSIGDGGITALYTLAQQRGETFSQAVYEVAENPRLLPRYGPGVSREVGEITAFLQEVHDAVDAEDPDSQPIECLLDAILTWVISDGESRVRSKQLFMNMADEAGTIMLTDLLASIETSSQRIEQELTPNCINVLTMHKAKGLTANAVIVLAAEDEHIPGRQCEEPELGDERRLLFVSLTRAKHKLFITYCSRRTGQQRMLGRESGNPQRTLTRFLRHTPLRPLSGPQYVQERCNQR